MPTAVLTDRATLTVTGADAVDLLQRLVTCEVEGMPEGEARLGALLAPQGKILFDFLVSRTEGGFRLDLPASLRADLLKRLTLYKLRAKVELREEDGPVVAAWDEAARPGDIRDGRLPALGVRRYGSAERDGPASGYEAHRIGLGIPEGGRDFAYGDAFPHEALMDQLGGVDFRKGCYVGQEVVSRMQHRGTARTRILPVTYPGGEAAAPGTEVVAGGKTLGRTGSVAGAHGLAMLRIDRLADAQGAGAALTAGGLALRATIPAFATFALPTPAATPAA